MASQSQPRELKVGPLDIIGELCERGLSHILKAIFILLDSRALQCAGMVSGRWAKAIIASNAWRTQMIKLYKRSSLWKKIMDYKHYKKYIIKPSDSSTESDAFYRNLYVNVLGFIRKLDSAWVKDNFKRRILKPEGGIVHCLQFDDEKIVIGLQNGTLQVYNRQSLEPTQVLEGHLKSVLCLHFDRSILCSGSEDTTVRVWNVNSWESVNILSFHQSRVTQLKLCKDSLVTASLDQTVVVWEVFSESTIIKQRILFGHLAEICCLAVSDQYICSGCVQGIIMTWDFSLSTRPLGTYSGHEGGIRSLLLSNHTLVSTGVDCTTRHWNLQLGTSQYFYDSRYPNCNMTLQSKSERIGNKAWVNNAVDFYDFDEQRPYFSEKPVDVCASRELHESITCIQMDDTISVMGVRETLCVENYLATM